MCVHVCVSQALEKESSYEPTETKPQLWVNLQMKVPGTW